MEATGGKIGQGLQSRKGRGVLLEDVSNLCEEQKLIRKIYLSSLLQSSFALLQVR